MSHSNRKSWRTGTQQLRNQTLTNPLGYDYEYSLTQKHCFKFSNEKSMFFSVVNIFEILPASSYDIYSYTYKVKKFAADGKPDL